MNEKIHQHLQQNCMTVSQLRGMLEDFDDDAYVLFATNYGDYHNTQQALGVESVSNMEEGFETIESSGYSHSGLAFVERREEDEDYDGYEGDEDEEEEDVDVVVLSCKAQYYSY